MMSKLVKFEEISGKSIPATTSKVIARVFKKEHYNVIRDIENYIESGEFNHLNFEAVTEKDAKGEERKMYILDEDFTAILIMGFTGKEAIKWKKAYQAQFREMRDKLAEDKVKREKGDRFALVDEILKQAIDAKRKEIEGKDSHIGVYVQLARRVNELAFGKHEVNIRQSMTKEDALRLGKTFKEVHEEVLAGVTNPSKLKEAVAAKRLLKEGTGGSSALSDTKDDD
jgi:Rha family phage regulatory protein